MKKVKVWINGKLVGFENARIPVMDRGFLYGDGVFETMRVYAGHIFRLDDHLARLYNALSVVRIRIPYSRMILKTLIYKSVKMSGYADAYTRVTITRGEGRFGINARDNFTPNVVIFTREFVDYPLWMRIRGIDAKVVKIRQNEYSPLSKIKSANYLNAILARFEAKDARCDEAIILNTKGNVVEATTSNVFLVKKGILMTPSLISGALAGVTRGVVLRLAKRLRLATKEALVKRKDIIEANEVFLTNSLVEILPVTRVDSMKIGAGRPGEITKLLHVSYQKEVIKEVLF